MLAMTVAWLDHLLVDRRTACHHLDVLCAGHQGSVVGLRRRDPVGPVSYSGSVPCQSPCTCSRPSDRAGRQWTRSRRDFVGLGARGRPRGEKEGQREKRVREKKRAESHTKKIFPSIIGSLSSWSRCPLFRVSIVFFVAMVWARVYPFV
jgi:hypothetical protein